MSTDYPGDYAGQGEELVDHYTRMRRRVAVQDHNFSAVIKASVKTG